ncbi:MAG: hypothetical protein HY059_02415 [Proteobacteria bacterium]|nr:hypothetical protein [Pseudomonadota bacterium]
MDATGVSGLTAAFRPVQQASLQAQDNRNSLTQDVTQGVTDRVQSTLANSAGDKTDISSTALTGRGMQLNISA